MKFVAIDTDIAGDRVTYALAAELGVSRRDAVGILTLFYAGVAKHADDGNLSAILDEQIEDWCLWSGARGDLAILLRTHLCDLSGVIRRWEDWNGAMIRKAKQDRERKRLARAASAERPRNVRGQSTDAGADNPRNGAGTVPDLTIPNHTTTTHAAPSVEPPTEREVPRQSWVADACAIWAEHVSVMSYGEMGKKLKPLVAQYGPDLVLVSLRAFCQWRSYRTGEEKVPGLPTFLRDFSAHVPRNRLHELRTPAMAVVA